MPDDSRIFLGMGSNMDDRYENLKQGIKLLNEHAHIWIVGSSHVYQSPAMYYLEQEDFYNMVIEIETNLNPLQLLDEIKNVEKCLGRNYEKKKNMPRTLDVDILAIGNLIIRSNLLDVPHPKISERKFVLKPWNDIASNFLVPNIEKNVGEILKTTEDKSPTRMVLILDREDLV